MVADMVALAKLVLCLVNGVQGETAGDTRADSARACDRHQPGEVLPGMHRGADQPQVVQVEPAKIEGNHWARHGPRDDPAAVVAQQRHQPLDPPATGDIGHRVQPARR